LRRSDLPEDGGIFLLGKFPENKNKAYADENNVDNMTIK